MASVRDVVDAISRWPVPVGLQLCRDCSSVPFARGAIRETGSDGRRLRHVYSPESCEIKGIVSGGMGREKMVSGY
jgi:hypothetical protein